MLLVRREAAAAADGDDDDDDRGTKACAPSPDSKRAAQNRRGVDDLTVMVNNLIYGCLRASLDEN